MACFSCGRQGGDEERFLVGKIVSHHSGARDRPLPRRRGSSLAQCPSMRSRDTQPMPPQSLVVTINKFRHGMTVNPQF